jgi:anaerobic selenocysteine-containing dehydrogenase
MDRALASLEFMASIDFYINETTRHAHIILPPTGALERGHYDIAFHLFGVRNIAKFSPPLFETNGDTRHEWQIFLELQTRMENAGAVGKLKRTLGQRFLGPERQLDLGLRFGPYGDKFNPLSKGLNLRKLKKEVHGIDLGPLRPCLPKRLRTSDKRLQLAPKALVEDIERVKTRLLGDASRAVSSNGHLLLIGRRRLRSNNSWMHNSERLVKGKPQCTMLMHPEDAAERALEQGQRAVVKSRTGSIEIPIEISGEMMPGVVCIPHGWGHDRQGVQLGVAQQNAGVSINDLTDNLAVDALCGTAAFNGTPVTVEASEQ